MELTTLLGKTLIVEEGDNRSIFERMLEKRGFETWLTKERKFLSPAISDLYDPFLFPGMDRAVERILSARDNKERVVIFGDYDVDGISSTGMLVRFFTEIGIETSYRLPHRVHDGYGMKSYFMDELAAKGVKLVISVDCGTRDIEVIKHAKELAIDVIVTDHHAIPQVIPKEVVAILNPKLPDSTYPFSGLAGAWVAFKLLSAVASRLFSGKELEETLLSFIDFASLGTVADMMPLIDENRIIVKLGLERLKFSKSSGLRKLIEGKNTGSADIIGFHIWPRINAAGRMDSPLKALRMLIASEASMDEILEEIEDLNAKRRTSTEHFVTHALALGNTEAWATFYESEEIEHGIIGLVAGRLCEAFGKPAVALKKEGDKYVASARAPEGFHLTDALETMRELFVAFWGHAQAAGFTLMGDKLDEFKSRFSQAAEHFVSASKDPSSKGKPVIIDAVLDPREISLGFIRQVESFGPYGIGFPKPRFLVSLNRIPSVEYLGSGEKHLCFKSVGYPKMVWFGLGAHYASLRDHGGSCHFVVELERETWRGRESVTLHVRDIALES